MGTIPRTLPYQYTVPATTMFKLAVLAAVLTVALASHKKCSKNGQFLPNNYDECSYIRCDYGDEPWYDEYGNIQFVPVVMKCPYGTSIDFKKDFSCNPHEHVRHHHHHHGYHPHHYCPGPCSLISDKCPGPPPPKPQPKYEPKYEPEPHHHHH